MTKMRLEFFTESESPVGRLRLVGDDEGLRQVWFLEGRHPKTVRKEWEENRAHFREAIRQLDAYFRGELQEFYLPLRMEGTEFQLSVWEELRRIPYGETRTYGQLAKMIGNPKAVRAVGLANGQNPIPIIVPCHRVIGSDGSLTGFGGGIENKRKLLELESGQRRLL
ncbi:MAG TPA: methylated-DNA--[protein]-cysteine S-methyltransferase [Candidatus Acidoferrum sp.]|nr:methylated-DNA--[protein]-cysteine S-methyltransferase [Candidatus Acidoferrum sp.]